MSVSSDPANFFQTESSIQETQRKANKSTNTAGNPIKLSSKILAITQDTTDSGRVFVAESAGTVRRVVLETGEKAHSYRGPTAPVTSLALSPGSIFAGCWDKAIWSWDISTRAQQKKFIGHGDFVKALLYLTVGGKDLLVSGGADAVIIVWDIASGAKIHVLKGHARGIQDLVIDPTTLSSNSVTIFSASSDREIRRWTIDAHDAAEAADTEPVVAHDTSVYKLRFDTDDDLWTASADNTAKCLSRERGWEADTELQHPDFVKDIVVDERGGWVVTACRDEEIRVWNRATGALHHTFSGHFEEVTGLSLVGSTIVSVSIDATIRQWSVKTGDLQAAVLAAHQEKLGVQERKSIEPVLIESLLTQDEERELADLMSVDE